MSTAATSTARTRERLLAWAERKLPALTRLRQVEPLPIALHRRRIYVLPTGFGVALAMLLCVMLVGALNYSNNPALLLTCVLGAAAWMSLFVGFRTLAGLELVGVRVLEAHAGDPVEIECRFAEDARTRPSLRMQWAGVDTAFSLHRAAGYVAKVEIQTTRRGWLVPGRLRLWTEQPFGMFIVWSWLNPDVSVLVYPALEQPAPPLPPRNGAHGARLVAGNGDEYSGLRDYHAGDPPRHIAWKASARHDMLLVRENEINVGDELDLDYASLAGLDHEARIRRLAAWVAMADAARVSYSLSLLMLRIGPGSGPGHRHACLRELALLDHAPD